MSKKQKDLRILFIGNSHTYFNMKIERRKHLVTLFLIIAMAVCLCGCSRYTKKDVLKHLQNKYGEEFTFADYPGAMSDSLTITVSCDRFPGEELTARVTPDGIYSDNYMGFYWRPLLEQTVEASVNSALGSDDSCKAYATISSSNLQGDDIDKSCDPSEYFSAGNSYFILSIFINGSTVDGMQDGDISEKIRSALQNDGVNGDGTIVIVKADSWGDVTREDGEYVDMKSGKFSKACLYILDEQYRFSQEKWSTD